MASKIAPGLPRAIHHFDKKKGNSAFVLMRWFGFVRPLPFYLLTVGIPGADAGCGQCGAGGWCPALVAALSPLSLPGQCSALEGGVWLGVTRFWGAPRGDIGGGGGMCSSVEYSALEQAE